MRIAVGLVLLLAAPLVPVLGAIAEEASRVPADAVLADLPFEPGIEQHRVIVDLAPEGSRPLRLMLDTGASISVMTPLAARDAGVSVRRTKMDPYRRETRLGRDLLFRVDVRSSDTGSRTGWEFGVLGSDFLASYVVELDFENERVRFIDPGKHRVPEEGTDGALVLPFELAGTRPVVKASLNGHETALLVDTGAPWTLVLSGPVAEWTGVEILSDSAFTGLSSLGPVDLMRGRLDRLALGGHALGAVAALVAPSGWYNLGVASDSVLGVELLERFLVRLDYPRRRLWLRPRGQGEGSGPREQTPQPESPTVPSGAAARSE